MKIAIVTVGELPIPDVKGGGAETLIEHIIEKNEEHKKLDIVVYSIYDEEAVEESKNFSKTEFVYLQKNNKIFFERLKRKYIKLKTDFDIPIENFSYKKVLKDIKKRNFDFVIIENTMVPYYQFAKALGKKVLLHTHWDYINNELPNIVLNKYVQATKKSSGIITVSEYIKKCILTVPVIEDKEVTVLKNCTDLDRFGVTVSEAEIKSLRKKNNIKETDLVFLFCGRISQEKGTLQLVKAFEKVAHLENIKLVITGSAKTGETITDEYTDEVHKEIEKIKGKIVFTGYIDNSDMPKYYQMADVITLPSTGEDPAPLTVFEAMASARPIITTYSGGISEYANDKFTIFCNKDERLEVELVNAFNWFVNNKDKIKEMGLIAREHVQKFNSDQYYKDFVEILAEINSK